VPPRPSVSLIAALLLLAVLSMSAAVYYGGTGRTPLAMIFTLLFVGLGGFAFELARRRSL